MIRLLLGLSHGVLLVLLVFLLLVILVFLLVVQEPPWGKGHTSPLDLDNVCSKRATLSVAGYHQAAGVSEPEGLHQHQVRQ